MGEFELQAGAFADGALQAHLKEILNPLELHENFVNRILDSAQQTAARLLQVNAEIKVEHIRLLVFIPLKHKSQKQIWGYFSVEKLEDTKDRAVANKQTIEIYLYAEEDVISQAREQVIGLEGLGSRKEPGLKSCETF